MWSTVWPGVWMMSKVAPQKVIRSSVGRMIRSARGPVQRRRLHHVLRGHEVVGDIQAQVGHLVPRLPQGHGQLGAVGLFEIGHIAHVINVGVAANHTHGREPRFPKASLQVFPLIVQTGVQENTMAVVQLVKGDELPAFQHPGIPLDLF